MSCSVHYLDHSLVTIPEATIALADVMLTDPPYSDEVHDNAVSCSDVKGARKRDFKFGALRDHDRARLQRWASMVRRWSVVFSDIECSWMLRVSAAMSAEYIRTIPWVRWSMPQLSGDRPTQGFEVLVCLHNDKGAKRWNGPGSLTHWEQHDEGCPIDPVPRLDHRCMRGDGKHPTEKPIDLCLDLVSWFSDPGETVFDPYAGSGTIGYACALLGRSYVGLERDAEWCAKANERLISAPSERDVKRIREWLARPDNDVATSGAPALARKARREADRARVRAWLGAA